MQSRPTRRRSASKSANSVGSAASAASSDPYECKRMRVQCQAESEMPKFNSTHCLQHSIGDGLPASVVARLYPLRKCATAWREGVPTYMPGFSEIEVNRR